MFRKALMLLDRGALQRGEDLLREVIAISQCEENNITKYRAMCCLGELLFNSGKLKEACRFLTEVESIDRDDDLLDYEKGVAKTIIASIDNQWS